tara:strand:- start:163 stop:474 length:312 start_codon:yes stop_codon:yes gene_type:complete
MSKKTYRPHVKTVNSFIIVVSILLSLGALLFNDFGLLKLINLKNKHAQLAVSLEQLLQQQTNLKEEIEKVQTDKEYVEKIAREKFMFVRPGEKVYRIQEIKEY